MKEKVKVFVYINADSEDKKGLRETNDIMNDKNNEGPEETMKQTSNHSNKEEKQAITTATEERDGYARIWINNALRKSEKTPGIHPVIFTQIMFSSLFANDYSKSDDLWVGLGPLTVQSSIILVSINGGNLKKEETYEGKDKKKVNKR